MMNRHIPIFKICHHDGTNVEKHSAEFRIVEILLTEDTYLDEKWFKQKRYVFRNNPRCHGFQMLDVIPLE
jgi:hypothetical protein